MRRIMVVLCCAVLLIGVSAPVVAANEPGAAAPIRGVIIDMQTYGPCPITSAQPVIDPSGCWYGHVTGDLPGRIAFWEDPPGHGNPNSVAWQFFEKFTYLPDAGGWFVGYDWGHWALLAQFRASGFVTDASAQWAHLVGYRFYERGVTTCGDLGCTAFGTAFFMAKARGEAPG